MRLSLIVCALSAIFFQSCSTRSEVATSPSSSEGAVRAEEAEARDLIFKFRSELATASGKESLRMYFTTSFLASRDPVYLDYLLKERARFQFKVTSIQSLEGRFYLSGCDVLEEETSCKKPPEIWVVEKNPSNQFQIADVYDDTDQE